jgi:hypothetical protein
MLSLVVGAFGQLIILVMDLDLDLDLDLTLDLETHARAMLQKITKQHNKDDMEGKQRLWRWALRGIVIQ